MSLPRVTSAMLGLLALAAFSGASAASDAPGLDYPLAVRGTTVDDYHGTLVPDPYRGLEDIDSAATRDWVTAESHLTEHYLSALPGRAQLRTRLAQLNDVERFGVPFQAHGRYFFTRNSGLQNQNVLYVADGVDDQHPRIALDPNTLSSDGTLAVVGYVASHDGRLLAYGVSVSDSNGGLLVGACITQRPDLFGAAIAGVGVMDMLRFDRFGQGAGWTGEYGTPGDAADFPALYAYSPLHRVRAGTRYPATLIITGDHDTRVMPMHSFKFAASMQASQSGNEPVLLYIEKSSGHGGGPTLSQAIEQNADVFAFLADRLGVKIVPSQ